MNFFENSSIQPQEKSAEEIAEIERKRKRVEELKKTDNKYQDSIRDLAIEEGNYRDILRPTKLDEKNIDKLSDIYSDAVLGKIEAEKVSSIDGLTGLGNRQLMNSEMKKFIGLEQRTGSDCSMLMLDMDFFKSVNDTYGHDNGDVVLKELANTIKSTIRNSDFAYRYGGEEFVVFLPNTKAEDAINVAEKIRAAVEKKEIELTDGRKINKTVSIGCVSASDIDDWTDMNDGELSGKLLKEADDALYVAKNTGRNKISIFTKIKEAA